MALHPLPGSDNAPDHCPRCGAANTPENPVWLGMGDYYVCDSCTGGDK